jgi:hypothetical protein
MCRFLPDLNISPLTLNGVLRFVMLEADDTTCGARWGQWRCATPR